MINQWTWQDSARELLASNVESEECRESFIKYLENGHLTIFEYLTGGETEEEGGLEELLEAVEDGDLDRTEELYREFWGAEEMPDSVTGKAVYGLKTYFALRDAEGANAVSNGYGKILSDSLERTGLYGDR